MKNWKLFFCAMMMLVFSVSIFAKGEKDSELSDSWKEVGNSVKDAASSLGDAISETGKKASDKIEEAMNSNFYGTWTHNSGKTSTTIKINEDKTMEISQKDSMMTSVWRGTMKGAVSLISFKIAETEKRVALKSTSTKDEKTWLIKYSVSKDGKSMTIKCADIPTTEDGHNFSEDTVFTLQ